jgi:hypothetical protein
MTTTRFRFSLPLLLLLLVAAAGIAGFAQAAKQKSAKSKSTASMPVLPPLPTTGVLKRAPAATSFTFVVLGDNRPAKQTAKQPVITGQLLSDMKQYNPEFILWTGDVIAGKDPKPKLIHHEYEKFLELAKTAGVPVFDVPGNHEMNAAENAPCPAMGKLYQKHMVKELYGAFAYGNSRFIALNTDSLQKTANCKPPTKHYDNKGYVNQHQLDSLDAYLKANVDADYIFIFMHRPMFPKSGGVGLNAASTAKLEKIFKKYKNIAYVLAAHEHLYYNALTKNDSPPPCLPSKAKMPFYLVSGGAGAPLSGDKDEGEEEEEKGEFDPDAFYNYLVFEVAPGTVKVTLVSCGTDPAQAQCKAQPSCAPTP